MTQAGPREIIVETRGLARSFAAGSADVLAIKDVSLEIFRGELLVILGRSGSGKTTLLNLLGGLDRPTNGQVLFEGQDLSTMSETELTEFAGTKLGSFSVVWPASTLSAYENVELPLRINGVPRSERRALPKKRWPCGIIATCQTSPVRAFWWGAATGSDCEGVGGRSTATAGGRAHWRLGHYHGT